MEHTTQEILQLSHDYTLYDWSVQSAVRPLAIDRAKGIYFWDTDGNRSASPRNNCAKAWRLSTVGWIWWMPRLPAN